MTKQAKIGEHPTHTLPESIQKRLECYGGPITSARYCGNFVTIDGDKKICVPTFVVTYVAAESRYVYVIDAQDGLFTTETTTRRQERQRKFGKDVNRLMEEYGFSWELGKVIINTYDIKDRRCDIICRKLQEAKEDISRGVWGWKKRFAEEPKETLLHVIGICDLDYWLDTSSIRVFGLLSDYLFANVLGKS